MMEKLLFVDTETTGVDERVNGIVQISGIIEIDGDEKEQFDYRVAPFEGDMIDPKALMVIGKAEAQLQEGDLPVLVHGKLIALLGKYSDKYDRSDKFDLVGFGATFDDDFLRAFFKKCNDNYYGSFVRWPPIDVAVLAATKLLGKRDMANFKLETVAEKFGIHVDKSKTHDALYDIQLTRDLFRKVRS